MLVDFYQLAGTAPEPVIAGIAKRVLADDGRLLILAEDEALLARLDRILWDQGATSFLPHALAGGADDARQPVLLSTSPDAPNLARNMLIADGVWRDSALSYDRSFFLFDEDALKDARLSWKLLSGQDNVERRYWARDAGKWERKA